MIDVFRKEHKELEPRQSTAILTIKEQAEKLLDAIQYGVLLNDEVRENPNGSREMSCAITKLEESVMWAIKHWSA